MRNVYRTTAMVTVFSVLEKGMSFLYRIFLSRRIGAEGVGIYQVCLSVFAVFLTVAASGIPVTVTRLMAKYNAQKNTEKAYSVVTAGIVATTFVTLPAALFILFGKGTFAFLFADKRCLTLFVILIPGLILTSVYAVMRGAFWGNKQFLSYSVIELAEDAVMVFCGMILLMKESDPVRGATKAVWAVLISYVFSFVVSLLRYRIGGGKFRSPKGQFRPLLSSAVPITTMRTTTSLLNTFISVALPVLLVRYYGMSRSEALAEYGVTMGMAVPVLFMPASLIGSIAVVLAPELSEHFYRNDKRAVKRDVEKSLQASVLIATVLIPLLFTQGKVIGAVLFHDEESGNIIRTFSFILLPMCISMLSTTLLNSLNKEKRTLIFFLLGSAGMLACLFLLTAYIGTYAYLVGLAFNFTLTAVCNAVSLKRISKFALGKFVLHAVTLCLVTCLIGTFLQGITKNLAPVWQLILGSILVESVAVLGAKLTGLANVFALLGRLRKNPDKTGDAQNK